MSTNLIPKLLNLSCTLTVVHDHMLGWDRETGQWMHTENGQEDMKHFPYGLDITGCEDIKKSMQASNSENVPRDSGEYYDSKYGDAWGGASAHFAEWGAGNKWSEEASFKYGTTEEAAIAKQKNYFITLVHIPTGLKVHFKALLTGLADTFATKWDTQTVYGRMDPVKSFQGTQRTVTISWDIPSSSIEEGIQNLRKCTTLAKMLYPTQSIHGSATSIKSPPMMAVKFANLISQGPSGLGRALTGTVNGFNFAPNIDVGFFEVDSEDRLLGEAL